MNYNTELNEFQVRNIIEKQNKLDCNLPVSYFKTVKIRVFEFLKHHRRGENKEKKKPTSNFQKKQNLNTEVPEKAV